MTMHKKQKSIIWYCVASLSALGLGCCILPLFPDIRNVIIEFIERALFHEKLKDPTVVKIHNVLVLAARSAILLIVFIDFWVLTRPGKYLLDKIGFVDIKESDISDKLKSFFMAAFERRFEIFVFLSGLFVFLLSFSRAANTGMTYDEAITYLNYVLPGFFDALLRRQILNNHILNSILARTSCFLSQTYYNEFFIRLPNLVFHIIYILFTFRIARKSNNRYFIVILCIANYYLNEFFSLARGYAMAAACILAALYYFDILRNDIDNKRILHKFFLWASLAVLANGIALYTVFPILAVLIFKYRKNIIKLSNSLYFFIFLFVALYVVFMSRPGKHIASTGSFYESIIDAVFGAFSIYNFALTLATFILFLIILTFGMVKVKFKNDYGLIYIIFLGITLVTNVVFHHGYPNSREMIPFYPVIVFVVRETLTYVKPYFMKRLAVSALGCLLCVQFIMQIDIQSTKDWKDDYRIRREVFEYLTREKNDKEAYRQFIDDYHNPVAEFYEQKYEMLLKEKK